MNTMTQPMGSLFPVDEGEGQADDEAAEGAVLELIGGDAQDGGDEEEGQDHFQQEAGAEAAVDAAQAVGAEAAGHVGDIAHLEDQGDEAHAGHRADDLGDDVKQELHGLQALPKEDRQGDGGVDVAAGDVADGVGHGHDGQAEGQGGEDVPAAAGGVAAHQHGGAAPHEAQGEGADDLGQEFSCEHNEILSFR